MKRSICYFVTVFFSILQFSVPCLGAVTFTINSSSSTHAISPYIYGHSLSKMLSTGHNLTMFRFGGNRRTAYNWENNASHAGSDWNHSNDGYLGGGNIPGEAVRLNVQSAFDVNAAAIVTVPIQGYVAKDKNGPVPAGTPILERFNHTRPVKGGTLLLNPDTSDQYVYQDEFVNWLETTFFPNGRTENGHQVMYMLDNEPGLWASTHPRIQHAKVTYVQLRDKSIATATMIKNMVPQAVVFGPVLYGYNAYVNLQGAPDAGSHGDFVEYYLDEFHQAHTTAGKRLLDVLDLHWYTEAKGGGVRVTSNTNNSAAVVAARVQAPRSLWDPTYSEDSWIARSIGGPIKLIPRYRGKIAQHYPGTKISFSEYYFGGGPHISGGVTQADLLGIFGREDVFVATIWPLGNSVSFIHAAFAMYRNYDTNGGSFGDTSIYAVTSDIEKTSVYASLDSTQVGRMVVVAINKSTENITANVNIDYPLTINSADAYRLTAAEANPVAVAGTINISGNSFSYDMPAMSVTTIVLHANSATPPDAPGSLRVETR